MMYYLSWILSVRDRMRREALKGEAQRRSEWLNQRGNATPSPERPASRQSEIDRDEILEMVGQDI